MSEERWSSSFQVPGTSWTLALVYAVLVIYGSLLPLDFTPLPAGEAWRQFREITYLGLGPGDRADWVANLLLYVPLTFLMYRALAPGSHLFSGAVAVTSVFGLALVLAVAIEFLQLSFPPRTVSLDDITAEAIGSLVGIVLSMSIGPHVGQTLEELRVGAPGSLRRVLWAYMLIYVVFSLFPYDFVLSAAEMHAKLASDGWAWWFVGRGCGSAPVCAVKLVGEAGAVAPFGVALALYRRSTRGLAWRAFAIGAVLGVSIEAAQMLVISAISQGVSVLTRAVGVLAGAWATRWWMGRHIGDLFRVARRLRWPAALLYVLTLAVLHGWHARGWLECDSALAGIASVHFLPFYYHYFSSETVAVVSVLFAVAIYAPVGLLVVLYAPVPMVQSRSVTILAGALGACAAAVFEGAKLFAEGLHPDPTNVLIAASTAALTAYAIGRIVRTLPPSVGSTFRDRTLAQQPTMPEAERTSGQRQSTLQTGAQVAAPPCVTCRVFALALAAGVAMVALRFPAGWWSIPLLLACAAAAFCRQGWRIAVALALLPVLDLAPWTGWFFADEFDLVLWSLFAGALWSLDTRNLHWPFTRAATVLLVAILVSYLASGIIGMWPWEGLGPNAFDSYYSHFNALRIAKAALWSAALLVLIAAVPRDTERRRIVVSWGMATGLAFATAVILWERFVFSGLLNFSDDYRVTGPFSALHTGGAYIEGYLVATIPFVAYVILRSPHLIVRIGGLGAFAVAAYAIVVTFSRNAYTAFAAALAVMTAAAVASARLSRIGRTRRVLGALALVGLATIPVVIALKGTYMTARFAEVRESLDVRAAHWIDALKMMDPNPSTALLGMGVGSYPRTYFWRSSDNVHPAIYSFEREGDRAFLRMGAGDTLYLEQFVALEPGRRYRLIMDLRSPQKEASITVPVCEKWLLTSFSCLWQTIELSGEPNEWRRYEVMLNSGALGAEPWHKRRTTKLSLFNGTTGSVVDIDTVQLLGADGHDLVDNGDFGRGNDRWFFSTDNHLPWHIKNMALHLYFEQGAWGLLAMLAATAYALGRLARRLWRGDLFSGALLASLAGFLVVGLFDSLVDNPRMLLLYVFLLGLAGLRDPAEIKVPSPPGRRDNGLYRQRL